MFELLLLLVALLMPPLMSSPPMLVPGLLARSPTLLEVAAALRVIRRVAEGVTGIALVALVLEFDAPRC